MLDIRLVTNFTKDDTNFVLSNVKIVVEDREALRKVEVARFPGSEHVGASGFFTALKDVAIAAYSSTLLE